VAAAAEIAAAVAAVAAAAVTAVGNDAAADVAAAPDSAFRWCSPRHVAPFNSINEGLCFWIMTWQALSDYTVQSPYQMVTFAPR
jgi:hypothetical protein